MPLQKTTRHRICDVRRLQLRRERAQAALDEFIEKSLPPLPAVSGIPGWARWLKAITNIEIQMTMIANEMENYQQCRSKQWKRSMQGYLFEKKLDDLRRITDEIAGWPHCDPDPSADTESNHYDRICAHLNRDVTP
jgi:hypothetical protein